MKFSQNRGSLGIERILRVFLASLGIFRCLFERHPSESFYDSEDGRSLRSETDPPKPEH